MDTTQLSKYIKTTADVADFRHILDDVADSMYKSHDSADLIIQRALPYDRAILLLKLASQEGVNTADKGAVRNFFHTVQQSLGNIPVVQINLAVPPKANLISLMHEWFYRNFQKQIILDIKVDPKLLAGTIISYNGKYYDYSLGKETEAFF